MRYLTYTPWPGDLNNTRMCFETVLVLAYLTGRCLVIPSEYRRHHEPEILEGRFRPLDPREFLDLDCLDRVVPIIERDEYDRTGLASRDKIDICFEPNICAFCFPCIPANGTLEAAHLCDFVATRQGVLQMTPKME